jgi:hypothetical protein
MALEQRTAELRKALQDLLSEVPAVSLRVAGERLGFHPSYLKELCPEECSALGKGIGIRTGPLCRRSDVLAFGHFRETEEDFPFEGPKQQFYALAKNSRVVVM